MSTTLPLVPPAPSSPLAPPTRRLVGAGHLRLAAWGTCLFLATQVFQALCFYLWMPEAQSAAADYATRLSPLDRARALAVLGGILALAVTYTVVALAHLQRAPLAASLGLAFMLFFVLIELALRGVDYALVSREWASAWAAASSEPERELLLARHALWGSITHAVYLPLMLSGLLAWTCLAVATWGGTGAWAFLGPLALGANALRTLGRLAASYTDMPGLGFLDSLHVYVVLVLLINGTLAVWLCWRARVAAAAAHP